MSLIMFIVLIGVGAMNMKPESEIFIEHPFFCFWCISTPCFRICTNINSDLFDFRNFRKTKPALGPTQPPIPWVPEAPSLGVKRPGRETHHSPPSRAEGQRMSGAIPPLPNTPTWNGTQLKHRKTNHLVYLRCDIFIWLFVISEPDAQSKW